MACWRWNVRSNPMRDLLAIELHLRQAKRSSARMRLRNRFV